MRSPHKIKTLKKNNKIRTNGKKFRKSAGFDDKLSVFLSFGCSEQAMHGPSLCMHMKIKMSFNIMRVKEKSAFIIFIGSSTRYSHALFALNGMPFVKYTYLQFQHKLKQLNDTLRDSKCVHLKWRTIQDTNLYTIFPVSLSLCYCSKSIYMDVFFLLLSVLYTVVLVSFAFRLWTTWIHLPCSFLSIIYSFISKNERHSDNITPCK